MKVVVDTNVLISGIFWGGVPLKVLDLWANDRIQFITSEEIMDEYLRTIQAISEKVKRLDLYEKWSLTIPQNSHFVKVKKAFHLCRDRDDNKFLDCAIAGDARYLITGDDDLLVLGTVMRVEILKPKKFLDLF